MGLNGSHGSIFLFFPIHAAGQLSQSAHLSLQLPYTVLGLGRSANFLDHLYVGIPRPLGDKVLDGAPQHWGRGAERREMPDKTLDRTGCSRSYSRS